jgi:hypothetical protein
MNTVKEFVHFCKKNNIHGQEDFINWCKNNGYSTKWSSVKIFIETYFFVTATQELFIESFER